jgi:hypothetical protein
VSAVGWNIGNCHQASVNATCRAFHARIAAFSSESTGDCTTPLPGDPSTSLPWTAVRTMYASALASGARQRSLSDVRDGTGPLSATSIDVDLDEDTLEPRANS